MKRKKRRNRKSKKTKSAIKRRVLRYGNSQKLKYEVKFEKIPAGYSLQSVKGGEETRICYREFVSSEDGDLFISRLEGLPSHILNSIPKPHLGIETSLNNMVALVRKDKVIQIFINYPIKATMQVKKPTMKAGDAIFTDDIVDVSRFEFEGIHIPNDVGIIVIISSGWRKGLYYDLGPCFPKDGSDRQYDINDLLGGYYAYLTFQNRFKISDLVWKSLFQNGWFPFITLKSDTISNILNHEKEGWDIDELLPSIQEEIKNRFSDGLKSWENVKVFELHMDFVKKAVEHYQKKDFISCISVLYPRIEGILREFQKIQGQIENPKQKDLADVVISQSVNPKNRKLSPLLPQRFNQYLAEVYFANFDPKQTDNPLSRNTIGHGIATAENFNLKGSTLGFLILDQLSYYFSGVQ